MFESIFQKTRASLNNKIKPNIIIIIYDMYAYEKETRNILMNYSRARSDN